MINIKMVLMTELRYEKRFQMRKISIMLEISQKRSNKATSCKVIELLQTTAVCSDKTYMKVGL
jgi:hypothetical protein